MLKYMYKKYIYYAPLFFSFRFLFLNNMTSDFMLRHLQAGLFVLRNKSQMYLIDFCWLTNVDCDLSDFIFPLSKAHLISKYCCLSPQRTENAQAFFREINTWPSSHLTGPPIMTGEITQVMKSQLRWRMHRSIAN